MKNTDKVIPQRVMMRIVSIIVCAVGFATGIYSFTLQVQDIGSFVASVCWFVGLMTIVLGVSGYVVTFDSNRRYAAIAFIITALLSAGIVVLEQMYPVTFFVILISLGAAIIELVILVVYRFFLKKAALSQK